MKINILIFFSLVILSTVTQAKLAGKPVVLVHGFNPGQLLKVPDEQQRKQAAEDYWSKYWKDRAEANLYWSSAERLETGIMEDIEDQFRSLNGLCRAGCVFVTHSTGDLVLRQALSKLGQWGLRNEVKVLLSLDFAGAGGGTEMADLAVNIVESAGIENALQSKAVKAILGFTPAEGVIGVLRDLRPTKARSVATANYNVPRLRLAGTGMQYMGVSKSFISGSDDSVVPLHSSCGTSLKRAYDSCNRSIKASGVLSSVYAPSALWDSNYSVLLMGEKTNHSDSIDTQKSGHFATVSNDFNVAKTGVSVDFNDATKRKWWAGFKKVRRLKNGDKYSMSQNVFETLNN